MNKKNAFTMLVLLSLLLTQFAFAPQTSAQTAACDAAQFVADVTIPDGTAFNAGDSFDKTWRLKNVGSCAWSTSYDLVFDTGNQMNASAATSLSKSVAPGETIDLTVKMTAPSTVGLLRGYWKLKNAAGVLFGIGPAADKSFWVEIRVTTSSDSTGYDFVQNAASATWTSGAGTLPFPGAADDAKGAGLKVDSPKLEDGSAAGAPGLLMVPQNVYNGFVQAQYPAYHVQGGDHFQSIVNCDYNATACYVNFRLDYQVGSGPVNTFWSFNERYEGLYYRADRDISSLAGQDVKFILRVGAAGYATGDRALWGAPRIANAGSVPPTKTPVGTPATPTVTPVPSSGCDRVTFVSDLDVPDGKVFAPNAAFTKTWRVKNTGTCTWTTSYKLVLVSGDPMGAASTEINLTSTIAPNTTVDIPVKLVAPATNGSYRGYWQFKNKDGALFGIGASADKPFWVDITVRGGSAATVTPTVTGTPPTPIAGATKTATPNAGPDRATFIADLSVPDGTKFGSSVSFRKTWRIRNTGTSTWGAGYKLVFVSGNQMSGPDAAPLPSSIAPNATVDLSVDLISPANAGSYRGYWQLKNASGALFGIGAAANIPFWVDILVTSGGVSSTATPTLSASGATPTVTATLQPSGSYAVVEIKKSDGTLNVRSAAGASNPLVDSLAYNATDIGKLTASMAGSDEWWQVKKASVTGWVNAFYLTEYLPSSAFCSDAKVTTLLTNLGTALKNADGTALAALVSPKHGVDIRLAPNNAPVNYNGATAASVFTSATVQNWGPGAASGANVSGTFKDIIQPKLLDVYNSSYQLSCNDTSKAGAVSQPWPSEYTTINLYSIYKPATAAQLDWRDFLVGIEYVNGQPYLFSLVHFEWVP